VENLQTNGPIIKDRMEWGMHCEAVLQAIDVADIVTGVARFWSGRYKRNEPLNQ
jgi:hypothetical protein